MKFTEHAKHKLQHGEKFPYDASDRWWNGTVRPPPKAKDWAHAAARGILSDLQGRHTIKWGFDNIDESTRKEIVASLAAIIREANHRKPQEKAAT